MKALIVGASKGFGKALVDTLTSKGWEVATISRGGTFDVDWYGVDQAVLEKFLRGLGDIDFVFFYQNGSALSESSYTDQMNTIDLWRLEKHWSQSYFASSILPYHIIMTVNPKRAGWMLSSTSYQHGTDDTRYGDYVGNKYQNYITMKNFSKSKKGCFFGLNPKQSSDLDQPIDHLLEVILTKDINGKVLFLDGSTDHGFDLFGDIDV